MAWKSRHAGWRSASTTARSRREESSDHQLAEHRPQSTAREEHAHDRLTLPQHPLHLPARRRDRRGVRARVDAAHHRRQPSDPEEPVDQAGAAQPGSDAHPALARQRQRTHLLRVRHRTGVDPRRRQQVLQLRHHRRPDVPRRVRLPAPHREHRRRRRRVHHRLPQRTSRGLRLRRHARRVHRCRAGQHLRPAAADFAKIRRSTHRTTSSPPASATPRSRPARTSTTRTSSTSKPRARD